MKPPKNSMSFRRSGCRPVPDIGRSVAMIEFSLSVLPFVLLSGRLHDRSLLPDTSGSLLFAMR